MTASPVNSPVLVNRRYVLTGQVQGVGFRPFVYRLASNLGLSGTVYNDLGQVVIDAQGTVESHELFGQAVITDAPAASDPHIHSVTDMKIKNSTGFSITASKATLHTEIHIPPDIAICSSCVSELQDKNDRRYLYPFINCSECGPRYSIIKALPYDRANTAMRTFPLCAQCQHEYEDLTERRFHAEPVACEQCGPTLLYKDQVTTIAGNEQALNACAMLLSSGGIVAIKGVGGYHLVCDATNDDAVLKLRQRKQRPDKPLALMLFVKMLDDYVHVSGQEHQQLSSHAHPIVLLRKKQAKARLSSYLAPGNNYLGVMLPYTALHSLLLEKLQRPLVMTSANISGEPVLTDAEQVEKKLAHICDAYLHHNRPILRPADDSVIQLINSSRQVIRSGRGLAPVELQLPFTLCEPVLATGGHMKNTIALAWDNRMVISPHIGDLGSYRSTRVFETTVEELQSLYKVRARTLICDAHPGYYSHGWAQKQDRKVVNIAHHYAHASSLVFNNKPSHNCLVFCWDGVGLGPDGALWGGETLLGRPGHWQRVASLEPFKLPGGEKCSRDAWRIAASVCWQYGYTYSNKTDRLEQLYTIWSKELNTPYTSAAGRLFSAAANLLGLVETESYEGHGPVLLQSLAEQHTADALLVELPMKQKTGETLTIEWQALLPMLLDGNLTTAARARSFHVSLAQSVVSQVLLFKKQAKDLKVGLTGGVFQNRLLVELVQTALEGEGITLLMNPEIPVNDAGISAGQVIEAYCNGQLNA